MTPPVKYRRVGVLARPRAADECARPLTAMRNFCLQCMGWVATEIPGCTAPDCWLFPYRLGKNPLVKKSEARAEAMRKRHQALHGVGPAAQTAAPLAQKVPGVQPADAGGF